MHNLLPSDGETFLFDEFFSKQASDEFLARLTREIEWKQEPITIFGKEIMQPRLTAWYGDSDKAYTYSGITMVPRPWNSPLLQIKEKIEAVAGVNFTSALLNLYRDGQDGMGWHRDNEPELGINPVIGSVTFGDTRIFKMKHSKKPDQLSLELRHGSFLLMAGSTQHHWLHSIPKTAKPKGPRINITFRVIV